jgi:hypothetical protein
MLVQNDYIVNRRKSATSVPYVRMRLVAYFGPDKKARDVNSAELTEYMQTSSPRAKLTGRQRPERLLRARTARCCDEASAVAPEASHVRGLYHGMADQERTAHAPVEAF